MELVLATETEGERILVLGESKAISPPSQPQQVYVFSPARALLSSSPTEVLPNYPLT